MKMCDVSVWKGLNALLYALSCDFSWHTKLVFMQGILQILQFVEKRKKAIVFVDFRYDFDQSYGAYMHT